MPRFRPLRSPLLWALTAASVLFPLGCSNEYLVLESMGAGGEKAEAGSDTGGTKEVGGTTAKSGGTSFGGTNTGGVESGGSAIGGTDFGGTGSGGTDSGGTDSGGTDSGGTDSGGTGIGGSAFGGSETGGTGSGGATGGTSGGPIGATCSMHAECVTGALCSGFQCVACATAPNHCQDTCAHGFTIVAITRNGCATCECAPASECTSNADCKGGETCYAGSHCEDGCSDPSCCFGNQCSPSGCGAPPAACLDFGCAGGNECLAACDTTSCECNGATWSCESKTGGATVASCPQACAPP